MNSPKKRNLVQWLLLGAASISALAFTFFGFFYYFFYWRYRDLFNSEGRYFDEKTVVVYHDEAGVLIIPTLAFLALTGLFVATWRVRRRRSIVSRVASEA